MSRIPYGVVSDTHNHGWNFFAVDNADGVNSRLQIIIDETKRAAATTRAAGGDVLFHGGDLFHVRGSIKPSVLNPTTDAYKDLTLDGFKVVVVAGNHDLEGKNSSRLGSAVTSLESIGCTIVNEARVIELSADHHVLVIPWHDKVAELKVVLEDWSKKFAAARPAHLDLIIHAPVDGVIPGLPDHGLDNAWLATLGFDRIFSGHYHNHKDFGNGVYSIGAIAHHTWGDVNSKAGFLISDDKGVHYNASRAPSFIEIDSKTDPDDIPLIVPGNYVKVKIDSAKTSDIAAVRQLMVDNSAKGVVVLSQKAPAVAPRVGATVKAGMTLEGSVAAYIDGKGIHNVDFKDKLQALCADILTTVKASAS